MKTDVAFWRRTPPALFPATLGLFGLGLAWQKAGALGGWAAGVGDLILGMVRLLFLVAFVPYAMKLLVRPAVLLEELKVMPARAGVAALSMSLMVMAAGLMGIVLSLAASVWYLGLVLHAVFFVAVMVTLLRGPVEQRKPTSAQHLPFVGFIVAPLAGVGLGYGDLSLVIFWGSLAIALVIWIGAGAGLCHRRYARCRPYILRRWLLSGLWPTCWAMTRFSRLPCSRHWWCLRY